MFTATSRKRSWISLPFLFLCTGYSCPHYDREGRILHNVVFEADSNRPQWLLQYDRENSRIKEVVLLPDRESGRDLARAVFDEEGHLDRFVDRRGHDLTPPATMHGSAEHVLGRIFFANQEKALRRQFRSRERIDLIHFGDSITWGWTQNYFPYVRYYGDRDPIVSAIIGNGISNLLYQLDDIDLEALSPKAVIINIGTNDSKPRGTIEETAVENAWGIVSVLARITAALPDTHIILMGIFPRGVVTNWHAVNLRVNELIGGFGDGAKIHFRNINHVFLNEDGTIKEELFDRPWILHPLAEGLILWAEAIEPLVDECFEEASSDGADDGPHASSARYGKDRRRRLWSPRPTLTGEDAARH